MFSGDDYQKFRAKAAARKHAQAREDALSASIAEAQEEGKEEEKKEAGSKPADSQGENKAAKDAYAKIRKFILNSPAAERLEFTQSLINFA